ncbi:MAG: hypothetical protein AMXMBFR64_33510 [Myxococcales bacterium]
MGKLRTGARDLGLVTDWRFSFVDHGTPLQPISDAVILDVGNHLGPGILDQHQGDALGASTSELVLRWPEYVYDHLMSDWNRRARDGQALAGTPWSPAIVTHQFPDFDGVVSAHLAIRLVEDGDLPPYAAALVAYSTLVDAGRYRVETDHMETATHAVHMAFLALDTLRDKEHPERDDAWQMRTGIELLATAMCRVAEARVTAGSRPIHAMADLLPGEPGVSAWRRDGVGAEIAPILDADLPTFLSADLPHARRIMVSLPSASGVIEGVPGLVLGAPPVSKLSKYWVRGSGIPYLIWPYAECGSRIATLVDGEPRFPRVVLSLDPGWRADGRAPLLTGLGRALEEAEVAARAAQKDGDTRPRTPRFADPDCTCSDPWYDGRGHGHTIVDSPRDGTVLTYEAICAIGTGPFWKARLPSLEVILLEHLEPCPQPLHQTHAVAAAYEIHAAEVLAGPPLARPSGVAEVDQALALGFPSGNAGASLLGGPGAAPLPCVRRRRFTGEGVCLDDVAGWLNTLRAEGNRYLLVRVTPGDTPARAVLERLGGGVNPVAGDAPLQVEGRTVVYLAETPAQDLEGAFTYSALLNETLAHFDRQVAEVFDAPREGRRWAPRRRPSLARVERVRRAYLRFLARHLRHEAAGSPLARQARERLAGSMGIDAHRAALQDSLDRLDQLAETLMDRRAELLFFVIGLAGVIQVVLALPWGARTMEDLTDKGVLPALWGSVLVLIAAFALLRRKG